MAKALKVTGVVRLAPLTIRSRDGKPAPRMPRIPRVRGSAKPVQKEAAQARAADGEPVEDKKA